LVKFLVQISFIVNLCLIFVYSKYVDGSDSRRNRLYFWWEESQSEIGLEGHGHREGKTLWLLYNLPHLENLNYNEWMSQLKQESLFFFFSFWWLVFALLFDWVIIITKVCHIFWTLIITAELMYLIFMDFTVFSQLLCENIIVVSTVLKVKKSAFKQRNHN